MKRIYTLVTILIALSVTLVACESTPANLAGAADGATGEAEAARGIPPGQASVVGVTATHDHAANEHLFKLNRDVIPSGWTTFQFTNASASDHFFLLYKAPQDAIDAADAAGVSLLDHWHATVTAPFQEEWNPFVAGDIDYGTFVDNLFAAILAGAPWFPEATTMGGPGLTAAGLSSETTVNLSPGEYIVECYVKDANEVFHSYIGMLEHLTVTEEESAAPEPRATLDVTVAQPDAGGISVEGHVRPGMHTVAIHFGDQPEFGYEHLLGHNVQLVRLNDADDDALLSDVADWVDWTQPSGLASRAPSGAEFLGGSMEMLGGSTAYYTVNLRPGDYAWIAEVPDPAAKGMLKTFSLPSQGSGRSR